MINLTSFALKNKAIVLSATALALAWGLYRYQVSPRREDPEYTVRTCRITTQWPGATVLDVENLVTDPLEEAINELDEVDEIRSLNVVGLSTIDVDLIDEITDVDAIWDKVRAKVSQVLEQLPEGCRTPFVNADFGDTAVMVLAVYQKEFPEGLTEAQREQMLYTRREMEIFADDIMKNRLLLIDGVARVDLHGVRNEAIYLQIDPGRWSQLDLSLGRLEQMLGQRNIVSPGGIVDTHDGRFNVKPTGDLEAVDDLKQQVIGRPTGSQFSADENLQRIVEAMSGADYRTTAHLEDLGVTVVRDYEDPPKVITRVIPEGAAASTKCIVLSIMMKDGYNVVAMRASVEAALDELESRSLPPDIGVEWVSDQPTTVENSIKNFVSNLYQAVLIVIIVAFLMMGLRVAIVMATAIPLVMIVSIGGMGFFGVEIEQMSLAALIIALGMLVDCAIEVADNVHRFLEDGYSRVQATIEGTQQIAFPVLMGTLTSVAAFMPMLMLPGSKGEYTYSLPVVVSMTLMLSWVLAMTVTAIMAYWLIVPSHSPSPLAWFAAKLSRLIKKSPPAKTSQTDETAEATSGVGQIYQAACGICIRFKLATIGIATVVFILGASLMVTGKIGTAFFPAGFRDQFVINVYLPEGTPIHQTDEVCKAVESILLRISNESENGPMLKNMASYVGMGGPRFYLNVTPEEPSGGYAQILINTYSPVQTEPFIEAIRTAVREGMPKAGGKPAIEPIPGVRVVPQKLDMGPAIDAPIGLRVFGPEIDELRKIAGEIKQALHDVPGTYDVYDRWGNLGYQMTVDVDEVQANLAGVTNYSIAQTLNAFYSGHLLTTYREGDHQVPVYLRLPPELRSQLDQLDEMYVEGVIAAKVPLELVAETHAELQTVKIRRRDRSRMLEVRSRVFEGFLANTVLEQAMPRVREIERELPPGYRIEIGGEQEETAQGQAESSQCFLISMLLIVFLLIVFFNSVTKSMIILAALPLAAAGSLFGLALTGYPLGFMEGLGFLSLAGIVINSGLVLIEFIEHLMKEKLQKGEGLAAEGERSIAGLSREAFHQCVVDGGRLRITPIALTTLTTVGGLIPLAISGGPLFEGLAIVLIFGLLLGSVLTLLVVPAIYCLFVEVFRITVFPSAEL